MENRLLRHVLHLPRAGDERFPEYFARVAKVAHYMWTNMGIASLFESALLRVHAYVGQQYSASTILGHIMRWRDLNFLRTCMHVVESATSTRAEWAGREWRNRISGGIRTFETDFSDYFVANDEYYWEYLSQPVRWQSATKGWVEYMFEKHRSIFARYKICTKRDGAAKNVKCLFIVA